jgi:hypothetical protein
LVLFPTNSDILIWILINAPLCGILILFILANVVETLVK